MSRKTLFALAILVLFILFSLSFFGGKFLSPKQKILPSPSEPLIPTNELDIAVCDPSNGPFSVSIDNPYMPFPAGQIHILENENSKVQVSVLNETEKVAGVQTRVVEEREWTEGEISEISRNYFVQSPDGTVCYYGEQVDEYKNGSITGHGGSWRADESENKPGIAMPGHPTVGQTYQQELAPGVAMDSARHEAFEPSYTTPAGTFTDVLLVNESPPSTKRYAPGVGMVFDDGAQLTSY